MAVNLTSPTSLLPIAGIKLATAAAGICYADRTDLVLMELAAGSTTAAVFTLNAFCAAPVSLCKEHLSAVSPRYLLINSGNANAGTGAQGMQAAKNTCRQVAELTRCNVNEVLPFSTGVIGQQLPVDVIYQALPSAVEKLEEDAWMDAAHAIMTTDTLAKGISKQIVINGKTITITGIAKGSGMICPDMATMLSYVATDAAIDQAALQNMLNQVVAESFNAITVDSDTSTNDSLILIATGHADVAITEAHTAEFTAALREVCQHLAQSIIRDGEGATKFVTIDVEQALSTEEARQVAYTVAHSPLVKTALFASDANWGRILAAVGRSKIPNLDVTKVSLWLGDTLLLEAGEPASSYTEAQGTAEMSKDEITIRISLNRGNENARIWTNDLSYEYVRINADYRS